MQFLKTVLAVSAAIVVTGLLLNELGKGKAGAFPQSLAKNITAGYGAGA